jgi:hypothetical protein
MAKGQQRTCSHPKLTTATGNSVPRTEVQTVQNDCLKFGKSGRSAIQAERKICRTSLHPEHWYLVNFGDYHLFQWSGLLA